LTSLKYLSLNGNQIKKIPDPIGLLENLTYSSLENNVIKKLPETIAQLKNLQYLSLEGNVISFEQEKWIRSVVHEGCKLIF